jgi:uncharacterized protein
MRRSTMYAVILVWLSAWLLCMAQTPLDAPAKPLSGWEGNWEGKLSISGIQIRIGFTFTKKGDGSWSGVMHSPDQGAKDKPLSSVEITDNKVKADFKAAKAMYEGQLSADGTTLKGEWRQADLKLPLELKRVEKISTLKRPQTPKKPYPYREEEVTYENTKHKVKLEGSLTLPQGDGPFPCVLLITGSGMQDRDETLFGHKPFLVLADHLTRNGIAVLRVDDRGANKSSKVSQDDTSADFMEDVLAGVNYLKTRKEINPKKIGLMGHSEGGLIAPMAAAQAPDDIAFIILLAGTGLPGDQIMGMQSRALLKATGAPEKFLDWNAGVHRQLIALLRVEKDVNAVREKTKEILTAEMGKMEPDVRVFLAKSVAALKGKTEGNEEPKLEELVLKQMEPQIKAFTGGWFRFFLQFDPRPTLSKVKCPVLALNGELDLQVPPKENLAEIAKALKAGGNADVTVKEFPKLNHLFQTCKTGSVSEYGQIEETIAPNVLECITEWIKTKTK